MEKQGWKIAAIVSTILLILVLMGLAFTFWTGVRETYMEDVCAHSICGLSEGTHDAYFYAPDGMCFCFNKGELDIIESVKDFLKNEG